MIPVLYPANATTLSTFGLGVLTDTISCEITEERNGVFECLLKYPVSGQHYGLITKECIVKAKPNDTAADQAFRIYRITKPLNGIVNHEAIIDPEVFEMVQREMAKRGKGKKYHSGVHAFSTKIKCGECGSWYGSKVWHSNSKYRKTIWQCNHKFDGDCRCQTPHLTDEEIQLHFLSAANKLLATKAAVIANGREMQALLFDTTELEAEQAQLLEETQVVSDMVQQAIQENARTALNQTEYQKRYDSLVQRFDRVKTRLEEVTAEIQERQTARANTGTFLNAFEQMPDALAEFSLESWHSMVDYATVYSADDIRFTFKNGQEIQA